MAKIDILFNNKNYNIDETSLATATAALKSHLSTVMSGTGTTINFDGTFYNVSSTKLSSIISEFISHLSKIAGSGSKVVIDGVEYPFDINKVQDAIFDLEVVLSNLHNPDEVVDIILVLDEGILDHSVLE